MPYLRKVPGRRKCKNADHVDANAAHPETTLRANVMWVNMTRCSSCAYPCHLPKVPTSVIDTLPILGSSYACVRAHPHVTDTSAPATEMFIVPALVTRSLLLVAWIPVHVSIHERCKT